jgi:hypothetical protein
VVGVLNASCHFFLLRRTDHRRHPDQAEQYHAYQADQQCHAALIIQ